MGVVSTGQITLYDQNETPMPELSSETKVVPSDADGSNPNLSGAASTFSVKLGTTDITNLYAVSATPSSGISGSLSGTTYTVSGMTADSGYVDFTATRAGWPTLTKRFSLAKQKQGQKGDPGTNGTNGRDAPRCLGLFAYASRGTITDMIAGDLAVLYSTTQSERGIYQYSGSAWSKVSSPTSDQVTRCFLSVLDAVRQGYGTSADYISGATSFETLLTKFLYALQITLDAKGWQKSSNYAEDTDGYPTAGFILDALNNVIKSFGSVFTQAIIKNAYFSGIIESDALTTHLPLSISSHAWTTSNTGGEVYDYFSSLLVGHTYTFSSSFSIGSQTISYIVKSSTFVCMGPPLPGMPGPYFYKGSSSTLSNSFTSTSISDISTLVAKKLVYDNLDHPPIYQDFANYKNTDFTLHDPGLGNIGITTFSATNANTDYHITLPSGGSWGYAAVWSGTYYASVSSKAGSAAYSSASGGTRIITFNKGGSGNLSGLILYWEQ